MILGTKFRNVASWILSTLLLIWSAVPASARSPDADRSSTLPSRSGPTCGQTYKVKTGESLGTILERIKKSSHSNFRLYGKTGMLAQVMQANKGLIKNPDLIHTGQRIYLPEQLMAFFLNHLPSLAHKPTQIATSKKAESPHPKITHSNVSRKISSNSRVTSEQLNTTPTHEEPESPNIWISTQLGGVLAQGSLVFPAGTLNIEVNLSHRFSMLGSLGGFVNNYQTDNVNLGFYAIQSQLKFELKYSLSKFLWTGLGYRSFTFGYPTPPSTTATSNDALVSMGTDFEVSPGTTWRSSIDIRAPLGVSSSAGSSFNSLPLLSGFSLNTSFLFAIAPHFDIGPYLFIDSVNMNLTQSSGVTTTPAFSYFGFGGGLQVGSHF